jgi:hypothetical protein
VYSLARHAGLFPPSAISSSKIARAQGAKMCGISQAVVKNMEFPIKMRNGQRP